MRMLKDQLKTTWFMAHRVGEQSKVVPCLLLAERELSSPQSLNQDVVIAALPVRPADLVSSDCNLATKGGSGKTRASAGQWSRCRRPGLR